MGDGRFRNREAPFRAYRQVYLGRIIHDSQKERTDDPSMKRQKAVKVKENKPPDPPSRHHLPAKTGFRKLKRRCLRSLLCAPAENGIFDLHRIP
jgi:hypothetical protein